MLHFQIPTMGLKREKWVGLKMAPTFLFLSLTLHGCDWKELFRPQGGPKKVDEQKNKAAEPVNSLLTSGQKFSFHRWLVTEMQEQIFARPSKGKADVDAWANVLSQRGSIEGVYHGLILSSEYAELERGRTNMKVVRFFAQEMAALDHPNSNDAVEAVRISREAYAKEHMESSLFTLKRILGEKVLKEANIRKADRERLAAWYSAFVGRWAKMGVSFGMPQRDRDDEAFHFNWAKDNNLGMIQWELLNRVHRVMNSYGGIERPKAPTSAVTPSPADK